MSGPFEDEDAPWLECERAWATWLAQQRYAVNYLAAATGRDSSTQAPLTSTPAGAVRSPDLISTRGGKTDYWEVKFRRRAEIDRVTGIKHHWMAVDAMNDYLRVWKQTQCDVWIVLYEAPQATTEGRWLKASVRTLQHHGHRSERTGRDGKRIDAYVWPVAAMEVVPGPPVRLQSARLPLLPNEGDGTPLDDDELDRAERTRRRRVEKPSEVGTQPVAAEVLQALDDEALGLDAVCRRLGLHTVPAYSVTRTGPLAATSDDLLSLLHYGIRVFLVTDKPLSSSISEEQLQAFRDSRLLEDALVPDMGSQVCWAVDGRHVLGQEALLEQMMFAADEARGINYGQYQIVHASPTSNIRVSAGAGTGKTETMAERLVFLLATSQAQSSDDGVSHPSDFTADQIALVTFTREAANQLRSRLSRTLMLRQRLCRYCVAPVRAWMMQLSRAQISTIHGLAKSVLRQTGAGVGYGPNFVVAQRTLERRRIIQKALSADLAKLALGDDAASLPAAYLWEDHLEQLWETLQNQDIALEASTDPASGLDWGESCGGALAPEVQRITRESLVRLYSEFRALGRDEQFLPTSQLVPLALEALQSGPRHVLGSELRYLFVDEFQDTDATQIDLFLKIHETASVPLFVVGDVKQGIYRFRGAAGNAFKELTKKTAATGAAAFESQSLTRNFRSGGDLLDSLHPNFKSWGAAGLLEYRDLDRLRTGADHGLGAAMDVRTVPGPHAAATAADQVQAWRAESGAESLAILCRENWQAREVQKLLREMEQECDVLVGGDFYRTPAVREFRVLLEALVDPRNVGFLLELCETRWSPGIWWAPAPPEISEADAESWDSAMTTILPWEGRVATLAANDSFMREDLAGLSLKINCLRGLLQRASALTVLVDCVSWFMPESTTLGDRDERERDRYLLCLDHLITKVSETFDAGSASLDTILDWLRLQIATNRNEDEPADLTRLTGDGSTVALSVHKAKGLEFDRVVVPFTSTKFRKRVAPGRTQATVVHAEGRKPQLLWEWNPGRGTFANYVARGEADALDLFETVKEETRLLYVAMTRPRTELVLLCPAGSAPRLPNTWAHLIRMVGN